jgi:hypothetical protein
MRARTFRPEQLDASANSRMSIDRLISAGISTSPSSACWQVRDRQSRAISKDASDPLLTVAYVRFRELQLSFLIHQRLARVLEQSSALR